jgi:hypothetical protein
MYVGKVERTARQPKTLMLLCTQAHAENFPNKKTYLLTHKKNDEKHDTCCLSGGGVDVI